jgi:hypothetical protein
MKHPTNKQERMYVDAKKRKEKQKRLPHHPERDDALLGEKLIER